MKYTKIAFSVLIAIAVVSMTSSVAFAITTDGGGSTATPVSSIAPTPSTPPTSGGGTTAGSISTVRTSGGGTTAGVASPVTTGGGTTAGSVTTPVTSGGGTTAGSATPATDGGGTTAGTDTSNNNGGGNTSGGGGGGAVIQTSSGGGSGFTSGGNYSTGSGSSLPILVNIGQCNYLTSYLKIGKNNPTSEVTKLQIFLKNTEELDVDVNGIFDQKTFDAVVAFQAKYVQDVMIPWGVTTPTGQVYYTTTKKINELYCKTNFALTPAQIAEIEAYRTSLQNGTAPSSEEVGSNAGSTGTGSDLTSGTSSSSTDLASDNGSNGQTASVAKVSIWTKIWNFIKRIFGR